jgi:hypothetical protein
MFDDPDSEPVTFDASVWEDLFGPSTLEPLPALLESGTPESGSDTPESTTTEFDTLDVAVPTVLTPLTGAIGGI